MPHDIDIDFDDRRRGEMVRHAAGARATTGSRRSSPSAPKPKRAPKRFGANPFARLVRHRRPDHQGVAAGDHAKIIPLSGITDPSHERYKEVAESASIETDPDVRTIYQTARGLERLIRNAGVHAWVR